MSRVIGKPFQVGNPGKARGTVSRRIQLWNELGEYLTTEGAERAVEILRTCPDEEFMVYYIKLCEYFKPKQSRVSVTDGAGEPINIIIPPSI
jgi:hypothetical protein